MTKMGTVSTSVPVGNTFGSGNRKADRPAPGESGSGSGLEFLLHVVQVSKEQQPEMGNTLEAALAAVLVVTLGHETNAKRLFALALDLLLSIASTKEKGEGLMMTPFSDNISSPDRQEQKKRVTGAGSFIHTKTGPSPGRVRKGDSSTTINKQQAPLRADPAFEPASSNIPVLSPTSSSSSINLSAPAIEEQRDVEKTCQALAISLLQVIGQHTTRRCTFCGVSGRVGAMEANCDACGKAYVTAGSTKSTTGSVRGKGGGLGGPEEEGSSIKTRSSRNSGKRSGSDGGEGRGFGSSPLRATSVAMIE